MQATMRADEADRMDAVQSGKTVVANMWADRGLIDWAKSQGLFVYIGRPGRFGSGPWGNPFPMNAEAERETVCDQHAKWLARQDHLLAEIESGALAGKVLGCFCKPKRCHGDILAQRANRTPEV